MTDYEGSVPPEEELTDSERKIIRFFTTDEPPLFTTHEPLRYAQKPVWPSEILKDIYKEPLENQLNRTPLAFSHSYSRPVEMSWYARVVLHYREYKERIKRAWRCLRGDDPYDYLDD